MTTYKAKVIKGSSAVSLLFPLTGFPSHPNSLYGCWLSFCIWQFLLLWVFQQNSSRRAVMDCSKPQSNRTEGAWVSFSNEIIQQKALLKVDLLSNKSSFMTQRLEGIQRRATETILGLRVELEGICWERKRYWHLLREKIEHVMCCTGWEGGCFQETSNERKTLQKPGDGSALVQWL